MESLANIEYMEELLLDGGYLTVCVVKFFNIEVLYCVCASIQCTVMSRMELVNATLYL